MDTAQLAQFTATARDMVRENELAALLAAWGPRVPAQRGPSS